MKINPNNMSSESLDKKINKITEKRGIWMTPRELLQCFGHNRRTKYNNRIIQQYLKKKDITTTPDYLTVHLDEKVKLEKRPKARVKKGDGADKVEYNLDPVSRIRMLDASNRKPVSINKEASLKEAITIMMLYDYSQLPVLSTPYKVDGMITWESIGKSLLHSEKCDSVHDCMDKKVTIISANDTLFDAVNIIIKKSVVLIKDDKNEISGLVTTTDIGEQFVNMSEPFLVLETIENHLRNILDGKFSLTVIREFVKMEGQSKKIEAISDLTFGQYVRLMESPDHWDTLKLNIDRSTFVKRLDQVRQIRNEVMHFHPDGIGNEDLSLLRETSSFFDTLSKYMRK